MVRKIKTKLVLRLRPEGLIRCQSAALHILESFDEQVAPALGWRPNSEGPVRPDPIGSGSGT